MTPRLSVIVPAFNEAERLPKTLARFREYFAGCPFRYEILLVLDGPTDGTRAAIADDVRRMAHVRVIDHAVNRGKGAAVRDGMLAASGQVRLFTDADNSTDIAHVDAMLARFEQGYDVVIGSRHPRDAPGARQAVPQPLHRRVYGRIGNVIARLLVVPGIWDTHCGFKAFRAEAAERVFTRTEINGWGFDIEVLVLARALNLRMAVIPARWINDARSTMRVHSYFEALVDIVKLWIRSRRLARDEVGRSHQ